MEATKKIEELKNEIRKLEKESRDEKASYLRKNGDKLVDQSEWIGRIHRNMFIANEVYEEGIPFSVDSRTIMIDFKTYRTIDQAEDAYWASKLILEQA